MIFTELYKIMVNKVTFVGFRGGAIDPIAPLHQHEINFCSLVLLFFLLLQSCYFVI